MNQIYTLVLEYIVISGVGRTAEADEMLRISPFFRSTIWPSTRMHILVTETTLQLISDEENSVALGI